MNDKKLKAYIDGTCPPDDIPQMNEWIAACHTHAKRFFQLVETMRRASESAAVDRRRMQRCEEKVLQTIRKNTCLATFRSMQRYSRYAVFALIMSCFSTSAPHSQTDGEQPSCESTLGN